MKTLVCFGDSNTWGYVPGSDGERFPREVRWPVPAAAACSATDWDVIAEGLNGRTATIERPDSEGRNGLPYLLPCLHSHAPVDVVVIFLGTNDVNFIDDDRVARCVARLVEIVRRCDAEPLVVVPAAVRRARARAVVRGRARLPADRPRRRHVVPGRERRRRAPRRRRARGGRAGGRRTPALVSRVFTTRRRISLSDTDAHGRLRLDAIARYLQDVASEDWLDAGFDHDSHVWVVRRTELERARAVPPRGRDRARRRGAAASPARRPRAATRSPAYGGGRVEAESIWIHLDHDLRPLRLDDALPRAVRRRRPPDDGRRRASRSRRRRRATGATVVVSRRPTSTGSGTSTTPPTGCRSRSAGRRGSAAGRARRSSTGSRSTSASRSSSSRTATAVWLVAGGEVRSAARLDPDGAREPEQLA